MPLTVFQSNMTAGEIDPQLFGRIDLQAYYNGLQTARNVLPIPQGGMKKRPGTKYIGTAEGDSEPRLELFSFSEADEFLLVFTTLADGLKYKIRVQFYKDETLITDINGSGFDYLDVPLTIDDGIDPDLKLIDFAQSLNTIIITYPDFYPFRIVRGSTDSDWTASDLPLNNIPDFNFEDATSPSSTPQIQSMAFSNIALGDEFTLTLNGIPTSIVTYAGSASAPEQTASAQALEDALQAHPLTATGGVSVVYDTADTFDVTFSNNSARNYDEITATAVIVADPTFDLVSTITQAAVTSDEPVWSDVRGYPRTVTFHEGRLYFGGSKSLPSTVWGSNVNDFFNFFLGTQLDDEGIFFTLDTDQYNQIQSIYSNRSLQIFTTGAEFYVKDSPITPSNLAAIPQTRLGSKRVRPVSLNGLTYFIQQNGKVLNSFLFLDAIQSNSSEPVSILSPHLIKDPVQVSVKRGSSTSDVNYIYLVNNDGTITVYCSVPSQDIDSFTRWEMAKSIVSAVVVSDKLHVCVEDDGSYYICVEDDTLNTDVGIYEDFSPGTSDTLTGLSHLEGETVVIKADGAVQDSEVVSGGEVTIYREATTIEAGLEYTALIETMPINVPLQSGPIAAKRKKIGRAMLQLFESNGVLVYGPGSPQFITDKTMAVNQFSSPEPQTGLRRIYIGGWSLEATLTITQATPFNMQILSIGMEVYV